MNSQSSSSSIISTERVGKSYNLQTGLQRFVRQAKSAIEFCAARIALPRQRQKDNPRSFFRFAPLVEPERDEYQQLLQGAKRLAEEHAVVRGVEVTGELYDLILFCVHSFVRPTSTKLYALKHNDITVEADPKRLLVTVRNGKTGYRVANTMAGAVSAYERMTWRFTARSYTRQRCLMSAIASLGVKILAPTRLASWQKLACQSLDW